MADDSGHSVLVTLWGDRARLDNREFAGSPVVALKGVQVKEWMSCRSGSMAEAAFCEIVRPPPLQQQKARVTGGAQSDGRRQAKAVRLAREGRAGTGKEDFFQIQTITIRTTTRESLKPMRLFVCMDQSRVHALSFMQACLRCCSGKLRSYCIVFFDRHPKPRKLNKCVEAKLDTTEGWENFAACVLRL